MKKKVLVLMLALVMVISMFAACTKTSTPSTPSEVAPVSSEETPVSSEVTPVSSEVAPVSSEVASTVTSTTPSATSEVASGTTSTTSTAPSTASSKPSLPAGSKIGSNPDYKLPVTITIVQEMHMGDSTENPEQKKLWADTLSARYGVKIVEDCITKTEVGTVYTARLAAGELKGVVQHYGWSRLFDWYNEGAIYPLDEYLKNNGTWKTLPKEMRDLYKINNQVYAVPSGWSAGMTGTGMGMWTQAIRADWVKKLGFDAIGYTLDVAKFKEIITAFGDNRAKLGDAGITPIVFGGDLYAVWNIFTAFDAFIFDPNSSRGYTYNPDNNCFEDALLKDGARQAIEYVRYFYTNGYTTKTTFDSGFADIRNQLSSAKVGSFCLYQGRFRDQGQYTVNTLLNNKFGTTILDNIGDGYTEYIKMNEETWVDTQLVGTRTKGLFANSAGANGYCLMKGTAQPGETINFFVDLCFSSENTWFELWQNLLDTCIIKESDGTYTRKYFDQSKNVFYSYANITTFVETEMYPAKNYLIFNQGGNKTAQVKRSQAATAYNTTMTQAAVAAGRVIMIDDNYKGAQNYSPTYVKNSGEIISYQESFIFDGFMKKDITVDKLFATYKKNMAAVGGDKVLQETNTAWGWVNDYQSYT